MISYMAIMILLTWFAMMASSVVIATVLVVRGRGASLSWALLAIIGGALTYAFGTALGALMHGMEGAPVGLYFPGNDVGSPAFFISLVLGVAGILAIMIAWIGGTRRSTTHRSTSPTH